MLGHWEGNVPQRKLGFPQAQEEPQTNVRADWNAREVVHHPGFLPIRAILMKPLWGSDLRIVTLKSCFVQLSSELRGGLGESLEKLLEGALE